MLLDYNLNCLTEPLLRWYAAHARVLPWRENVTPYRVWVSEIMLQQTRVEAVKPYFNRFIEALPSIEDLANCEEERLLKLWEGLGYYNRVRNMQEAARTVMSEYDGRLPADPAALLFLPGIGRYTAGAIASIAYNLPVPAVDGNVLRILMRVTADDSDITRTAVRSEAERRIAAVIPEKQASEFNQALMELGATVCLPNGTPLCNDCPWNSLCEARKQSIIMRLPVKKEPAPRKCEDRTILIIRDKDRIALHKRPDHGLLAGMYEFPGCDGHLNRDEVIRRVKRMNLDPLRIERLEDAKHIFSHVEWHITGYLVQVDSLRGKETDLLFVSSGEIQERYPIPAAFQAYTNLIL